MVFFQDAQSYADDNSLLFMETSAKTSMNVNEIFMAIGKCFMFHVHYTLIESLTFSNYLIIETQVINILPIASQQRNYPRTSLKLPERTVGGTGEWILRRRLSPPAAPAAVPKPGPLFQHAPSPSPNSE